LLKKEYGKIASFRNSASMSHFVQHPPCKIKQTIKTDETGNNFAFFMIGFPDEFGSWRNHTEASSDNPVFFRVRGGVAREKHFAADYRFLTSPFLPSRR
jgi:hypothetical protein